MTTLQIQATVPQAQFYSLDSKFSAFVAGYGSGKTEAMLNQAILDALVHPRAVIALYAPTFDLIRLNAMPRLEEKLKAFGLDPVVNKVEHKIITKHPQCGSFRLRSLDNPARIIAYESFRAHIDELDTLPMAHASEVWQKVIARNRQKIPGYKNRVSVYTTPEGFKFVYNQWVKNKTDEYKIIHASTYSNEMNLPEGYIQSLINTYPEELIKAYINGEFVNLTSGTVYYAYKRRCSQPCMTICHKCHKSEETIKLNETLYIGCDFNVTKQAATVYVQRANTHGGELLEWHAVAELVDMYDTPDMINKIKAKWPNNKIIIYPDASGNARKSVDASKSDIGLLEQAGFEVRAKKTNPLIKDRVLSFNCAVEQRRIFINDTLCPNVADCLEQQAYDEQGNPDKKSGHDHQNDATTYPIAYEFPINKPILQFNTKFLR